MPFQQILLELFPWPLADCGWPE